MSKFYKLQGLRGSLLYIVRLRQVTEVRNIHYLQAKNEVMSKFYKLQGLRGSLLYIVRLRQVTEDRQYSQTKNKVMSKFYRLQRLRGFFAVHCEVTTGYRGT